MMKCPGVVAMFVALTVCMVGNARANLIQGQFSGTIDINGSVAELQDGAVFSGSFIYDTSVGPTSVFDTAFVFVDSAMVEVSFELEGVADRYRYASSEDDPDGSPWPVDVRYPDTGRYTLDFDYFGGKNDFIEELDLEFFELLLEFDNTFITDSNTPIILPDAGNFVPGLSFAGSVLYMWVADATGGNPGSAQLNGNITSLTLSPYSPSQPIPEPVTLIQLVAGLACLAGYRRWGRSRLGWNTRKRIAHYNCSVHENCG